MLSLLLFFPSPLYTVCSLNEILNISIQEDNLQIKEWAQYKQSSEQLCWIEWVGKELEEAERKRESEMQRKMNIEEGGEGEGGRKRQRWRQAEKRDTAAKKRGWRESKQWPRLAAHGGATLRRERESNWRHQNNHHLAIAEKPSIRNTMKHTYFVARIQFSLFNRIKCNCDMFCIYIFIP